MKPITEILSDNSEKYGQETALVEINPQELEARHATWREYSLIEASPFDAFRSEMTWGDFEARANRFANFLLTRKIKKGDKVAILLMNCLEWLPVYFGILRTGAMAVPLNYRYTAEEIRYCLDLSDASVLVFGPEFTGRIEDIADSIPKVGMMLYVGEDCPSFAESYPALVSYCSSRLPHVEISLEDDAAIYFSSGTTGFPKAIVLGHSALAQSAEMERRHHGQTKDDVFLCIPPLYHTGAKMHWFGSLISASKAVLLRGVKPEWILRAISQEKCTIVWLLVPWAQDVLDYIDGENGDLSGFELKQWRLMHIGAQPVPPSLINRWMERFPGHMYDTNYGLSESTGPGCVHLGVENIDHVGAIGIPGYGWEARIVDSGRKAVAPGEVGELAVRGPGVMKEYYKDKEATAAVLDGDGWLYTGDMAMEKEGFIYLVDRKKDVIITGGENIYPVQIEDFIRSIPAVKDVAVIGLPDSRLGEVAAAIIELKPGAKESEESIMDSCKRLPRYKRPRKIIFADVPRNPTGKIEKPLLRKRYCKEALVAMQVGIS